MTDAGAGATAPLVCAISRRRRVPRAVAFVSLLSLLLPVSVSLNADDAGALPVDASITIDAQFDGIEAHGFAANTDLTVEIYDSQGGSQVSASPQTIHTDAFGDALFNGDGIVDLVPGMFVSATDGLAIKGLVIARLAIDLVDLDLDQVTGFAEPGALVHLEVGNDSLGTQLHVFATGALQPDGTRSWSKDFSGIFDVNTTTTVSASVADLDGDRTEAQRGPPQIFAGLEQFDFLSHIDAGPFAPGVLVTFDVYDSQGGQLRAERTVPVQDSDGFVTVDIEHIQLLPGMFVRVTDGVFTKELLLQPVTIAGIDPADHLISGTAHAGAGVQVHIEDPSGTADETTAADINGDWSADFGGSGVTVTALTEVAAYVRDEDFDATTVERFRPRLHIDVARRRIEATSFETDHAVTFHVYDHEGGTLVDSGEATADAWGTAVFNPTVPLTGTMNIVVSDGLLTKTVPALPAITVDAIDPVADIATGTAPPDTDIAVASVCGLTQQPAHVDGAGNWSIDYGGDFKSVAQVCTGVLDDLTPEIGADIVFSRSVPIVSADPRSDVLSVDAFAPSDPVTLTIYALPSSGVPLWTDEVATDQNGHMQVSRSDHGQDLVAGMFARATQGGTAKELTIDAFSVDVADPVTGTVSGTAPDGRKVTTSIDLQFTAKPIASGGAWNVDVAALNPDYEWNFASIVDASLVDAEGDRTVITRGAAEEVSGVASPGGTVTTDTEGDGATSQDPVETWVTSTVGGAISINEEQLTEDAPLSFSFLGGQQIEISAPTQTGGNPLVITFRVDVSRVPARENAQTIAVYRNGAYVPACAGAPGVAYPDPCVSAREDLIDGDALITMLSSHASLWGAAASTDARPPTVGSVSFNVNPKKQRDPTVVSAAAADALSGLGGGEFFIGPDPGQGHGTPMTVSGSTLQGTIGTLAPGSYTVGVRAQDRAGNWSSVLTGTLVVQKARGKKPKG